MEDAFALKISSFMLDQYAEEYEEMLRTRNAHAIEMDTLRTSNRNLSVQVCVPSRPLDRRLSHFVCSKQMESSMAQLNTEHCELLVSVAYTTGFAAVSLNRTGVERARESALEA